MTLNNILDFCLRLKATEETFPFDQDTLVLKVGGKMYALLSLSQWEMGELKMNLKCDPDLALELRASFDAVQPGYHMNKKHWNTVSANLDLSDDKLFELIQHSYNLVFNALPKKIKESIKC